MICRLITLVIFCFSIASCSVQQQRVHDEANILSTEDEDWITTFTGKLLEEHDIDFYLITHNRVDDISQWTHKAFERYQVGSHSQTGRGILFVIDPQQDSVRIEISAALEGIYTDAFISYIQNRQMVPFFARNRVSDGVLATTEFIFRRARDAEKGLEFTPLMQIRSTGAGAQTEAKIGAGDDAVKKYNSIEVEYDPTGLDPDDVVNLYYQVNKNRDNRPDLALYSEKTREWMKDWLVTAAQYDNGARALKACKDQVGRIIKAGQFAVVRYKIERRDCAPYFLVLEDGAWRLDLLAMSTAIRFNHKQQWHLNKEQSHHYWFGFKSDIMLDENGYPHLYKKPRKLRWGIGVDTDHLNKIYVIWVQPDSASEKMGLQEGDQIIKVQDKPVSHHLDYLKALAKVPTDADFSVQVIRADQEIMISGKAPAR